MPRRSRIQDRLVRRTKKGSRKLQKVLGTLALVSMVYGNVGSYICRYTLKATIVFAGSITPGTIRIRDALRLPAGILARHHLLGRSEGTDLFHRSDNE